MKLVAVLIALYVPVVVAAPPESFSDAWAYLSSRGHSERWLVVSSKTSRDAFFQCENLDDVVRCVIPIWVKRIPQRGRFLPADGRGTPYPEVKGSRLDEKLDQAKVEKVQAFLKAQGLTAFYVYSRVKDEQMQVVGTQCDLRVMVPFSYKRFEKLATGYLKEIWGATETDRYDFETNN